jgi:poly(glycerol-phosphate) alpha-glucosyltransferase
MVRALEEHTRIHPHVVGVSDPSGSYPASYWGTSVYSHQSYGPRRFLWAPKMGKTLEKLSPDVLDIQGLWMNLSRVSLRHHKKWDTPFVITPRGMLDSWALQRSPWRKRIAKFWFENEHLAHAAAIRALNQDEAESIRQFGIECPIVIIPNGVDAPNSVPDVDSRLPIIQYLGRLDPKKGLEPLILAWSKVMKAPSASGWMLRVSGWGTADYTQRLERQATAVGLGETIQFTGPLFGTEKEITFGQCAGFILPSFSEGLPMAVLEAWSWGAPVLMTRECNLPESFTINASIEITTNPDEMAQSIIDFIEMSTGDQRALAQAGRQLVASRYSAQTLATDLERLYLWLAGHGKIPDDLVYE